MGKMLDSAECCCLHCLYNFTVSPENSR